MQTIGIMALVVAGGILWFCVRDWSCFDADPALASMGSVVEAFREGGGGRSEGTNDKTYPLVAQAETFALILNPPAPPKKQALSVPKERPGERPPVPDIRPAGATPKFKVIGTSCPEIHPERSMALIVESGSDEARWVREGEQVGHLTIHEISPGVVVCRAGEERSEIRLEYDPEATAVATSSGSAEPERSRIAADDVSAARPSGLSRRPASTRARTVGSARTAALN